MLVRSRAAAVASWSVTRRSTSLSAMVPSGSDSSPRALGDHAGTAIGGDAQRPQPLGNIVRPLTCVLDHLVEFEVQRAELRAYNVPMRLFALQAEVNQIH